MLNISLKWRIFVFYLLFGLVPLALISYLSIQAYSGSIARVTERQMSELVENIASQTDSFAYGLHQELDLLAGFPYVQLSYLQYPSGLALSSLKEKLELFRINTGNFDCITLYSNDGRVVATTSAVGPPFDRLPPDILSRAAEHDYHLVEDFEQDPRRIILIRKAYDYRNPERVVGLVSVSIKLGKFLHFTQALNLGPGITKKVINAAKKTIYAESAPPLARAREAIQSYAAGLPLLGWTIEVSIPESVLFADVNQLKSNNLTLVAVFSIIAVIASLAFSRMAIKPLKKMIAGSKEFASGNLDHRIHIKYGVETKRLADEFNLMAKRLKTRQEELIRAGKLASLGLLTAGFAHEVKNPLAGIKTSAQVLEKKARDLQVKGLARGITTEVDRLDKIVSDLLAFSRPRSSRREAVNLAVLVERSLELLQSETNKKGVQLNNRVSPYTVMVDRDQMIQVFINLLLNALSALMPSGGCITLDSWQDDLGQVRMSITDNGRGIPEEKLPRIFDPFFSLSREGTGLGLSIVHTLLRMNKVGVTVSSTEGKGSTFELKFASPTADISEERHG